MAIPFLKNSGLQNHYMTLDQRGKIQAEYVWLDADGECRAKTTTLEKPVKSLADLKEWNFDGSSTNQAPGGHDSDIYLRPAAYFPDPFRLGDNVLVLAECYNADGTPNKANYRHKCAQSMKAAEKEVPWFGIEQEYSLFDIDDKPYGWPKGGFPGPQGPYYCGVGAGKVYARDLIESHYRACLYAGINISGINAEVMPSQWEYQVGPCVGVSVADDLWMSRFLLHRIAEEFGIVATLDPKPMSGDWNGAGAHTNVSTKTMREKNGITAINEAVDKLSKCHLKHIKAYDPNGGKDNERRLTGRHETSSIHDFSAGVAHRGASIRIPRGVADAGCGYFEDRRPSSNCDPYSVVGAILSTICLNK